MLVNRIGTVCLINVLLTTVISNEGAGVQRLTVSLGPDQLPPPSFLRLSMVTISTLVIFFGSVEPVSRISTFW